MTTVSLSLPAFPISSGIGKSRMGEKRPRVESAIPRWLLLFLSMWRDCASENGSSSYSPLSAPLYIAKYRRPQAWKEPPTQHIFFNFCYFWGFLMVYFLCVYVRFINDTCITFQHTFYLGWTETHTLNPLFFYFKDQQNKISLYFEKVLAFCLNNLFLKCHLPINCLPTIWL